MFRVILHLDMDAFFASVEQRDDPKLRGQPVIVGAPPTQRGVVCAASYEARKFGVRSALPSATAGRLCTKGIFVRPRMDAYREESHRIMEIIATTGAVVEQMSVDEAYIDVSAICQAETADSSLLLALPLARELKQRILSERQLTATDRHCVEQASGQDCQRPSEAGRIDVDHRTGKSFIPAPAAGADALRRWQGHRADTEQGGHCHRSAICRITPATCGP